MENNYQFESPSGISIQRRIRELDYSQGINHILEKLNRERGIILSSGIEYPGRYSRWEIGFHNPPLEIISQGNTLTVMALNAKGSILLKILLPVLTQTATAAVKEQNDRRLVLEIEKNSQVFSEEERSRQPSVFSPLRTLMHEMRGIEDDFIGLYGAFAHDLIFQFETIDFVHTRSPEISEMRLFLPDHLTVVDRYKEITCIYEYDFKCGDLNTIGGDTTPFQAVLPVAEKKPSAPDQVISNCTDEEYAEMVEQARDRMAVGDVYELVLHRRFSISGAFEPVSIYRQLIKINPSPYQFFFQFGDEQLIGASPEMFIRLLGDRIESCPISGTVRSGGNPMEDAANIKNLLNSTKDEVELTMCTDVDRNDKARICEPGSVRLIARRIIERYAGLFHTVDHVEGLLRKGFDGIDALLSHMWAVTLTGTPKIKALQLIEQIEKDLRMWYGGAIGALKFNGDVSTGITIRTLHMRDGQIHYRVGATLVYDSDGAEEELETRTKATSFFNLLDALSSETGETSDAVDEAAFQIEVPDNHYKILLVDNEDSFVHILADYFRQAGGDVVTYRHNIAPKAILDVKPDLVVHSPGPSRPEDFGVPELVLKVAELGIAQFGVCLGLQGIALAFGGRLGLLEIPWQGKYWTISHDENTLFTGVPSPCEVGAYHALHAIKDSLPDCLQVSAENQLGIVMAIRHRHLPIEAVQFHPESILSMRDNIGHRIIRNAIKSLILRGSDSNP